MIWGKLGSFPVKLIQENLWKNDPTLPCTGVHPKILKKVNEPYVSILQVKHGEYATSKNLVKGKEYEQIVSTTW